MSRAQQFVRAGRLLFRHILAAAYFTSLQKDKQLLIPAQSLSRGAWRFGWLVCFEAKGLVLELATGRRGYVMYAGCSSLIGEHL